MVRSRVRFSYALVINLIHGLRPSNSLPSALGDQMSKYGQAITLSILSAQYVFTIAEEAKSLIQQLASDTTQEEVSLYMAGMSDLAKSGLEKTTTALSVFKDVRQALIAVTLLISPIKSSDKVHHTAHLQLCQFLQKCVSQPFAILQFT